MGRSRGFSLGPQALLVVTCAMTLEALAAFPLYVQRKHSEVDVSVNGWVTVGKAGNFPSQGPRKGP